MQDRPEPSLPVRIMNRRQRRRAATLGAGNFSAAASSAGDAAGALDAARRLMRAGDLAAAADGFRGILKDSPDHPDALHLLGIACYRLGDRQAAIGYLDRSVALAGDRADFHCNRGNVMRAEGRLDDAAESFRRALAQAPGDAPSHNGLGEVHRARGETVEAAGCFRRALAADPEDTVANDNLGYALKDLGDLDGATDCFRRAVAMLPNFAEGHSNLGNLLRARGQGDEAIVCFRRALAIKPDFAEGHNNLGNALRRRGDLDEATACFRRAIELQPGMAAAYNNLAIALAASGQLEEAVAACRQALEIEPDLAEACSTMGNALSGQGRFAEAVAAYREALKIRPGYVEAHSNLLFCMHFDDDVSAAEILEESRRWNMAHAAPRAGRRRAPANDPNPDRRLRIGYVSPDFRRHAIGHFLESLFAHRDRSAVEVFCYAEVANPDPVTDTYRDTSDHWRSTVSVSDGDVADRIRGDRIDILVDLAGHTAGNRLLVFAGRPAPIQLSHLAGYGQTTGMAAMDYVLTDSRATPASHEDRFSETPWRLPRCFVSFEPSPGWPGISPLPAAQRGHVTFAAFGKPARTTPSTIALWARAVMAVPGSRLLLKHPSLTDTGLRARLMANFSAHGLEEDRIDMEGVERGWAAEMDVYERVDIALDSFPVTGGSTTCIQLWMGIPVVTLASDAAHDRFAAGFVNSVGLDECIAHDPADFARCAAALAGDLHRLAHIRAGLRDRMRASPLLDHEACARAVEDAYRGMWRKWCAANG